MVGDGEHGRTPRELLNLILAELDDLTCRVDQLENALRTRSARYGRLVRPGHGQRRELP